MSRILIVSYSRSGNTEKIANALTEYLQADLETIQEPDGRDGWGGFIRSVLDALRKRSVPILPGHFNVTDYDLVVVGTPVWAGHVSAPVRTFLSESGSGCKALAFFCTMGGNSHAHAFDDMEEIVGKAPLSVLAVPERDLAEDRYTPRARSFALTLQQKLAPHAPPTARTEQGEQHVGV